MFPLGAAAKWAVKHLVSSDTGFSSCEGLAQASILEDLALQHHCLAGDHETEAMEGDRRVNLTPTPEHSLSGGAVSLEVRWKQENP